MLEVNIPDLAAELTQKFESYERALVAKDLAILSMLFWNSDHMLGYGVSARTFRSFV